MFKKSFKEKPVLKKIVKIAAIIVFALIFYFAGYVVGHKNLIFEANYKPKIINKELVKPRDVDFGPFWKAWQMIQDKYVGQIKPQDMVYGAISGLVDSLKDPYSLFMAPDSSKTFLQDLSGQIQGIGAEISIKDNVLTVISPLTDSPAEKAGLKPNDQILKIDDNTTDTISLDQAIQMIRGEAGTKVKLTIMRSGWTEPKVFEITRDKITIKSVEWSMKTDTIGYIKISQFGDDTTTLTQQAATELKAKNAKSIILDLRHNPGGYLESAVDVSSLFIKPGVVVKEQDKNGSIQEEKTTLTQIFDSQKVIVLVDGGSASASEIVAGALQDTGRAQLIGEKTFGKGSVQELQDLGNGATLRLTIAKWLTPNNRAINGQGIEPDIKVTLTDADAAAGRDPQLDKAMELAQ